MVSQVQGFVHLLATAADGGHEPQVFRMRWDQPLKRFARAYAVFRELTPEAEAKLNMSTKSHGELDPAATPGVYGLTDGDQVVFTSTNPPEAPTNAGSSNAASSHAGERGRGRGRSTGRGGRQGRGGPGGSPKEAPPAAAAAAADQPMGGAEEEGGAAAEAGGAAEAPAEEAAPPAAASPRAAPQAKVKEEAQPKAAAGKAKSKGKAKAKGKAKGKAKAKGKGKAKAKAAPKADAAAPAKAPGVVVAAPAMKAPPVYPGVPRNNVRAETVKMGPAKGWRVVAWLQDVTGTTARNHDRVVRWRISSPGRSRTYSTFRTIQDDEGEGVYAQIYTAVRPQLLRRINDRRQVLEGRTVTPPQKKRHLEEATTPAPPLKHGAKARPPPLRAPPPLKHAETAVGALATQRFPPPRALAAKVQLPKMSWDCSCEAHLRRHPRCAAPEEQQPELVHLRDYMLVGRGDSCDIILHSRRTPQMISRCHAVLHKEGSGFALVDQGSLNGMLVNGDALHGRRTLANGDIITFGVPSTQPEFDYVFEERPLTARCPAAAAAKDLANLAPLAGA